MKLCFVLFTGADKRKQLRKRESIQYNITGPLKVSPRMMGFHINEGGTGDMWVVGDTGAKVNRKVYESTSSEPSSYFESRI
jgi:hypothetical protein